MKHGMFIGIKIENKYIWHFLLTTKDYRRENWSQNLKAVRKGQGQRTDFFTRWQHNFPTFDTKKLAWNKPPRARHKKPVASQTIKQPVMHFPFCCLILFTMRNIKNKISLERLYSWRFAEGFPCCKVRVRGYKNPVFEYSQFWISLQG